MSEALFWIVFVSLNAILYLINYLLHFEQSHFLPYISQFLKTRKLGLVASTNHDPFRYSVEFSLILILSRIISMEKASLIVTLYFVLIMVFNLYQYIMRRIYENEPNLYSDAPLLKNAVAIIWHESKWKLILGFSLFLVLVYLFNHFFYWYLAYSSDLDLNIFYYSISSLWFAVVVWAILKFRFYLPYPNDIYQRYHFTLVEIWKNYLRSITNSRIAKRRYGPTYRNARSEYKFTLKENVPNIHILFIESYGSYFFKEPDIGNQAWSIFDNFSHAIQSNNWSMVSNYSTSPTNGGQSWLTYSSFLYGIEIANNTYFENYLNDPDFNQSNSLLRILKNCGYTNYNLNPISPIKGINVPYSQIRNFYSIDEWILNDTLNYHGDVYGFGECPPDQYSMNFAMDLIEKENKAPFTFFYLTKNSHSPFIPPKIVANWKELNHQNGSAHVHKGFLKQPTKLDYVKAMHYQFQNLEKFISDHCNANDIVLLIGDHQPPYLCDTNQYGFYTPVHVISQNSYFLDEFTEYGFQEELNKCSDFTRHEALCSIFLRAFLKQYGQNIDQLPDYEPNGIQL